MEIINYTEKSFVLFGEKSKEVKEELKQLGGRFNPNLTHPETKEKLSAWVFSKKALEKVQNFIQSGELPEAKISEPKTGSEQRVSRKSSTPKKKKKEDPIDQIVDPISRLGLKDNGPDPVKKSRKSTKLIPTKEITRVVVSCSDQGSHQSFPKIEIQEDESITPEIVNIPSFSMIVPKVGMKVEMKDKDDNEFLFEITKTISDMDGYIFEFQAEPVSEDSKKEKLNFIMVGRQWRIASTLSPIWMNLVK